MADSLSPAQLDWVNEFLTFKARNIISESPEATKAAYDFSGALGGGAGRTDFEGWLKSEPHVVYAAAAKATQTPSQIVPSEEFSDEVLANFSDEEIGQYQELIALLDRLQEDSDISAEDMEALMAQAEAGLVSLSFEDESVGLEVSEDGDITLESSTVQ